MIGWLRALAFYLFGFSTVCLFSTCALLLFWAPQRLLWKIVIGYARLTIWAGNFFCGMRVVIEGEENLPDGPVLS